MFAEVLNPPPEVMGTLCRERIEAICHDILKKGSRTTYTKIYDAIYELVEATIEDEYYY
jgi:hypothetical protein